MNLVWKLAKLKDADTLKCQAGKMYGVAFPYIAEITDLKGIDARFLSDNSLGDAEETFRKVADDYIKNNNVAVRFDVH